MTTYKAVHIAPDGTISDVFSLSGASYTLAEADAYLQTHLRLNPTHIEPGEYRVLTVPEYRSLMWSRDWSALTQSERDLFAILWPRLTAPEFDPATSKSVAQLKAIAPHRLHKLGLSQPCSRCGGTGTYSRCERFGTTCFKCGGSPHTPGCGYQMPTITRKLIALARERMAKAVLDESGKIVKVEV